MQLNLPILEQLSDKQSILLAGAGGGFDIFAGLPIYFALREHGKTVHLANYSFCDLGIAGVVSRIETLIPDVLIGTHGDVRVDLEYLPEPYLAQWFKETRDEDIVVWMFANTGAAPLTQAYRQLAEHLSIDAVLLVDGGVDSLMRGDESGAGTLIEDTLSLIAVSALDVPLKMQICIGFGTEVEESVCHYNALENMAALTKAGAFLGGCALTARMPAFQHYEAACRYVWDKPDHHKSHISTRIIPAVHGDFGNIHMYKYHEGIPIMLSPLMSLYWFFDATAVIERNLLVEPLRYTEDKQQAFRIAGDVMATLPYQRPRRSLPY